MIDAPGREHGFEFSSPSRVVSLVPSMTETLFDLGAGASVIAVTDYCIFPEAGVELLPRVGGTKNPVVERIRALEPDLVHMNSEENLERHAREIEKFAPVFFSEPKTVADVARLMLVLGAIHDCRDAAKDWVARLHLELSRMPSARRFTFACPIWKDPWMWCGGDTYVSSLVESAGGRNVLGDRRRYPRVPLDEVIDLAPDLIFLPDEPYAFTEDDRTKLERLGSGVRIIGPFPGHLFTWHGTRTILGLRYLRGILRTGRSSEAPSV